jgi:YfiH family protein
MISSPLLAELPWLVHGFGTREGAWSSTNAASVKQIHSGVVWTAEHAGVAGEGDAMVTATPGLDISIRTADCYAILLADSRRRAVAAIHAGWRGTAARIVEAAIAKMHALYGSEAGDLYAAIGPGIGVCCYEVGSEVASQFSAAVVHNRHLDLASANREQLLQAGMAGEYIEVSGLCTFCEAHHFHSYRRDKQQAGRMTSFVRVR